MAAIPAPPVVDRDASWICKPAEYRAHYSGLKSVRGEDHADAWLKVYFGPRQAFVDWYIMYHNCDLATLVARSDANTMSFLMHLQELAAYRDLIGATGSST